MKYADILTKYLEERNESISGLTRKLEEQGVKVDRSYISKVRGDKLPPPSDEVTVAIAKVLGYDPMELLWAALVEKSHPELKKSLMNVDLAIMKRGIELERKYPIPDHLDEYEADKYIESIPEYKKFYDDLIENLEKNGAFDQVADNRSFYNVENIVPAGNFVRVPIIGTVAAGNNGLAYEENIGHEWVEEDSIRGGSHFFLKVKGDSMIGDGILPGDLALIKETPDVEYGDLAVVIVNGEEGTIKRVFKKDDSIILQASNPSYPPRVFKGNELNDIRIVGKVIQTIRNY